ncbi:unnamed protein product [Symbiodinium natans]|uniref:Uncharacterized protein n=1 Tax=Symbiodinium natans TaxID=878477 RepID=A0A812PPE3_9DINO|nr:unnamed protein product [Symbiodinium natans]
MPGGVGREYLDFSFDAMRRISFVAVKIPPLPYGPLSVRDFHVLAGGSSESPESWVPASPVPLQTLDRADLRPGFYRLCSLTPKKWHKKARRYLLSALSRKRSRS